MPPGPAARAQLTRLTARLTGPDTAAGHERAALRARVAAAAALRDSLAELGIDPAGVAALRFADEAAAELAAIPDSDELRQADAALLAREEQRGGDAAAEFEACMLALAQRYRDDPEIDFAQASLAHALAWCAARLMPADSTGERISSADPLQMQSESEA